MQQIRFVRTSPREEGGSRRYEYRTVLEIDGTHARTTSLAAVQTRQKIHERAKSWYK
jgi:hypothetical protein